MFLIGDQEIIILLSLALLFVFITAWFIVGIIITKNKEKIEKMELEDKNDQDDISKDLFETESITKESDDSNNDNAEALNAETSATFVATQDKAEENLEEADTNNIEKIEDITEHNQSEDNLEDNSNNDQTKSVEVVNESKNNKEIDSTISDIDNSETQPEDAKEATDYNEVKNNLEDNQSLNIEEANSSENINEIDSNESNIENIETQPEDVKEAQIALASSDEGESLEENIQNDEQANDKHIIVPTKKGRTYNGKYEIFQVADGYAYCLKASNGEVLVTSETYISRDGVIKAIEAVKRNLETGEVRIFADKRGKYKFKLVSKNYRVLAISSTYSVEKSAVRASESFKKFALKADIVDIEVLDNDFESATVIEIKSTEDKQGGKFVIEKFDGEFSWDLKSSNGQILCQTEGYTSKAGCMYSIETFKKNVEMGVFKCIKDKAGRYCYKLYTPNGRVIAIGESYPTKASAEASANSVVSFYKLAAIEEIK